MALGAASQDVASALFVRHGIVLAGIGIVCGMAAAALLTRTMSALLFGVSAYESDDLPTPPSPSPSAARRSSPATSPPAARRGFDPAEALRKCSSLARPANNNNNHKEADYYNYMHS